MPSLLSGSTLRRGGSGEFIDLAGAQPQLPATLTTETGFTLITNNVLQTFYRSSLGFIEFDQARLYANRPDGTIRILATGTTFLSTSTSSGNLVVEGGVGVGGNMYIEEDIVVNGLTIGKGYENGYNNISIYGQAEIPLDDFTNGQQSIRIGWNALDEIETSNKSIAIGRYALSSGTELRNSIAIGDSALKNSGSVPYIFSGTITNITRTSPVVVTVPNHNLTTGTSVLIYDVEGMPEIMGIRYYVDVINASTVNLYTNSILSAPLDGSGFTSYISSGTINKTVKKNNNIAIGTQAAESLIDGEENFFFGGQIARNLTTGSYNIFIGNDVANNLKNVSGSISIGGDNIVDGINDQINIGSVFYYNGLGKLDLNAATEIGLGNQSTNSDTGALTVIGGAGISDDLYIGNELHITGNTFATGDILPETTVTNIGSAANPFNSLYLKGSTLFLGTVTLKSPNDTSLNIESVAGFVRQTVGSLTLNSNAQSNSFSNGALIVTGGAGFSGDVNINGQLNVNGTENVDLSPAATVYIQPTINGTVVIRPAVEGELDNVEIGYNDPANAKFTLLEVVNTTTSTSTTTGALIVNGGTGIKGNVYANTGIPQENYLLYTPRTYVQTAPPPANPRLGDFWVDIDGPFFLQYVQSGVDKVWVQVT